MKRAPLSNQLLGGDGGCKFVKSAQRAGAVRVGQLCSMLLPRAAFDQLFTRELAAATAITKRDAEAAAACLCAKTCFPSRVVRG